MPTVLRLGSHLLIGRDHTGVTLTTVHGTGAQIHGITPESGGTDGIGATLGTAHGTGTTHGIGDVRDIIGHGIMTRGIMILGIIITITTIIIGAATIITAMEEGTCIGATEARPPATAAATSWA